MHACMLGYCVYVVIAYLFEISSQLNFILKIHLHLQNLAQVLLPLLLG